MTRSPEPLNAPPAEAPGIAFVYDDDAHLDPSSNAKESGAPGSGVFGRHVANSEFLEAWFAHGEWQRMVGVVGSQHSASTLAQRFADHPRIAGSARRLELVGLPQFQQRFFPEAPARVLHLPQPIDPEFAWARQHRGPHSFALSGVTHTLSLKGVMENLRHLVTAPFEAYDTLFCISKAAIAVVRTQTDNYAAFLRERQGGEPRARIRLAHVPFGVDTQKFRPATPEERAAAREQLGIAREELCVLFVGRQSYFSKAHPFPLFRATAEAARRLGCKVHLLFAGWADAPSVQQKFQEGAQALAPGVRTSIVDAMRPHNYQRAWQAADLFSSLSDNIQETLGLTILEAQASGLPVVISDWDGCRDNIAPDETGFAVPTRMVRGATSQGTSRHLWGETKYNEFLGETNQAVAVDVASASGAFERLFADGALRARMAAAARTRILTQYTWAHVIRQYEEVWREQEIVRQEHTTLRRTSVVHTPVPFPDVEHSFASFPSTFLDSEAQLMAPSDALSQLDLLLRLPLCNYLPHTRIVDRALLAQLLAVAQTPCSLASLETVLGSDPASHQARRATLAWLLKYDLLRVA